MAKHTTASASAAKSEEEKKAKAPRQVRLGRYKSFRFQSKKIQPAYEDLLVPGGFRIFGRSFKLLLRHWKIFGSLLLLYAVLNWLLAGGFVSGDVLQKAKDSVSGIIGGDLGKLAAGATLLATLATSGGSQTLSEAASAYQVIMLVVMSLIVIWTLRQVHGRRPVTLLGALYNGPAPLIPFIVVVCIVAAELLPMVGGVALYISVVSGGVAQTWLEQLLILLISFLVSLISVYWTTASFFALYIVTLPNMTPLKAVRSANELVRYRRFMVLRKLLVLPFVAAVVAVFVVAPVALTFTAAAPICYFILLIIGLAVAHSYMYSLYRELIG